MWLRFFFKKLVLKTFRPHCVRFIVLSVFPFVLYFIYLHISLDYYRYIILYEQADKNRVQRVTTKICLYVTLNG
jgi:hypothetical protein